MKLDQKALEFCRANRKAMSARALAKSLTKMGYTTSFGHTLRTGYIANWLLNNKIYATEVTDFRRKPKTTKPTATKSAATAEGTDFYFAEVAEIAASNLAVATKKTLISRLMGTV